MNSRIGIFLISFCVSFCMCNHKGNQTHLIVNNKFPLYQNCKVELHEVVKIGGNSIKDYDSILGSVSAIIVDEHDNIYILSRKNRFIKKFSKKGRYLSEIGKGAGQGPGEYLSPYDLAYNEGKIYINDLSSKTVSVFDTSGRYLKRISYNFLAGFAGLMKVNGNYIYLIEHEIIKEHRPIGFINIDNESDYGEIGFRCQDSLLYAKSGNSSKFAVASNGDIFHALQYPYKIICHSKSGKNFIFTRKNNFFKKIEMLKSKRGYQYLMPWSYIGRMDVINNRYLIVKCFVIKNQTSEPRTLLDFFNLDGKWLCTIDLNKCDSNLPGLVRADYIDKKGYLYLSYYEPYPHIIKYSFIVKNIDGTVIF